MTLVWIAKCDNCPATTLSLDGWTSTGDKHFCPRSECQRVFVLANQAMMLWELATMRSAQAARDAEVVQ